MKLGCGHCTKTGPNCDCPKSVQTAIPLTPLPCTTCGDREHDAERTIRTHADEIRMQILRLICDNDTWDTLVELAVERATSIGAQAYGTSTWHKLLPDVREEGNQEIADLIFYLGVTFDLLDLEAVA